MRPVLFTIAGLPVQSYGASKVLAAFAAAWLLARAFARHGLPRDHAYTLTFAATMWGFAGAKAYYLAEHARTLSWRDLGGMGFTWYGGLLAGVVAARFDRTAARPADRNGRGFGRGTAVGGVRHRPAGLPARRRRPPW